MKIPRSTAAILTICVLNLAILLAGYAAVRSFIVVPPPRPLLVKNNGPGPYYVGLTTASFTSNSAPEYTSVEHNQWALSGEGSFSIKSSSGGATNVHLQGQLVKVALDGTRLILTNKLAGAATNYFVQAPGYFNGDQIVDLNTSSTRNYWKTVRFELAAGVFDSNSTMDTLLLILGSSKQGAETYETASVYAVDSKTPNRQGTVTNYCGSIVGSPVTFIKPGVKNSFHIYCPGMTNLPATIDLKSYLSTVQKTLTTNSTNTNLVATNFALAPITPNLTASDYESGTNLYVGTNSITLDPSGFAKVEFILKPDAFEEVVDCMIAFVGVSTNGSGKIETAVVYPIDTDYIPEEQSAGKK